MYQEGSFYVVMQEGEGDQVRLLLVSPKGLLADVCLEQVSRKALHAAANMCKRDNYFDHNEKGGHPGKTRPLRWRRNWLQFENKLINSLIVARRVFIAIVCVPVERRPSWISDSRMFPSMGKGYTSCPTTTQDALGGSLPFGMPSGHVSHAFDPV